MCVGRFEVRNGDVGEKKWWSGHWDCDWWDDGHGLGEKIMGGRGGEGREPFYSLWGPSEGGGKSSFGPVEGRVKSNEVDLDIDIEDSDTSAS